MLNNEPCLQYHMASNQFGKYCIPLTFMHCGTSKTTCTGMVYELATIHFIRSECGIGDVVHAGAFFGDFIPGISTKLSPGAMLWTFEPDFECCLGAASTIHVNNLKNVRLMNVGLGVDSSLQYLSTGGRVVREKRKDKNDKMILIMSLDKIIPIDRNVSIIHLDVELFEHQVLIGAVETIKRCKPILILETLPPKKWLSDNILSLGYVPSGKVNRNFVLRQK